MELSNEDFILLPGGVHLWGSESPSLGAIPDDVVEKESEGYTLNLLQVPGWRYITTENVVVGGDVPDQALKVLAVSAEELNKMLERELPGKKPRERYGIKIFDKRNDFCKYASYCGASNAQSLYNPQTKEMALHFGPNVMREEFELNYAHEFTHAYMDYVYDVRGPLWFAEGMAEYYSHIEWTAQGYQPTRNNLKAVLMFRLGENVPLPELLRVKRSEMYGLFFSLFYAQSWALVHFLMRRHPELIEELLRKKHPDLSSLEEEYQEYLKELAGA